MGEELVSAAALVIILGVMIYDTIQAKKSLQPKKDFFFQVKKAILCGNYKFNELQENWTKGGTYYVYCDISVILASGQEINIDHQERLSIKNSEGVMERVDRLNSPALVNFIQGIASARLNAGDTPVNKFDTPKNETLEDPAQLRLF